MSEGLFDKVYNPDVLSCLANLSSDEVFTPPSIANAMLDMLPQEIFSNPDTRILDPACKSGVFLREAAKRFDKGLSSRKPFGLPTNYEPQSTGVPCWFIQRIGMKYANRNDVDNSKGYLDSWKLLVPKAPIAGQTDFTKQITFYYNGNTRIAKPGECCTESWIVAGAFSTEQEALSYRSYIFTKIVRFLLLQTVVSQDVTRKNYCFIPDLGNYNGEYTDEKLCEMWNITKDEWEYIDSRIATIGGDDNG